MVAVAVATATLASAVADAGTFTLNYPAGVTRQRLIGTTGGVLNVGVNDVYNQGNPGFEVSFGVSNMTITNRSGVTWAAGAPIIASFGRLSRNGSFNVTIGNDENQAAPGNGRPGGLVQELTASGAVNAATQWLDLNHISVVIAATANALDLTGLFVIRDTSASGTAAHTVTLTNGTFNGTNTVATLNAPGEQLVVLFDPFGRGTIIENIGAVALS